MACGSSSSRRWVTRRRCPMPSRPRWGSPHKPASPIDARRGRRAVGASTPLVARQLRARRGTPRPRGGRDPRPVRHRDRILADVARGARVRRRAACCRSRRCRSTAARRRPPSRSSSSARGQSNPGFALDDRATADAVTRDLPWPRRASAGDRAGRRADGLADAGRPAAALGRQPLPDADRVEAPAQPAGDGRVVVRALERRGTGGACCRRRSSPAGSTSTRIADGRRHRRSRSTCSDHFHALVRKSLVTATSRVAGTVRYGLLETIRQFAEYELAAGWRSGARARSARGVLRGEVTARWAEWNGPGFRDAVDWVTTEFANLRAAFRWSAAQGDAETAVDIAAHAAMIGVSTELVRGRRLGGGDHRRGDDRRCGSTCRGCTPRRATAASPVDPEQAVAHAQNAAAPRDRSTVRPVRAGWATFIEALAQVYCGRWTTTCGSPARWPPPRCPRAPTACPGSSTVSRRPGGRGGAWTSWRKRSTRRPPRQSVVDRVRDLGQRVGVRARRSRARPRDLAGGLDVVHRDGIHLLRRLHRRAMPRC